LSNVSVFFRIRMLWHISGVKLFSARRSQKRKKMTVKSSLFCAFRIYARKMLMKPTLVVFCFVNSLMKSLIAFVDFSFKKSQSPINKVDEAKLYSSHFKKLTNKLGQCDIIFLSEFRILGLFYYFGQEVWIFRLHFSFKKYHYS